MDKIPQAATPAPVAGDSGVSVRLGLVIDEAQRKVDSLKTQYDNHMAKIVTMFVERANDPHKRVCPDSITLECFMHKGDQVEEAALFDFIDSLRVKGYGIGHTVGKATNMCGGGNINHYTISGLGEPREYHF